VCTILAIKNKKVESYEHTFRGGAGIGAAVTMPGVFGGTRGGTDEGDVRDDGNCGDAGEPGTGVVPSAGERIGESGLVGLKAALNDV
jgi:hypothetical protein